MGPERNSKKAIGCGDAVRLRTRGILRRVQASRGRRSGSTFTFGWERTREAGKRDEPHDRQRDATSPWSIAWRKPSRWCKTTRAERESTGGTVDPKASITVGVVAPPRRTHRCRRRSPGVDAHSSSTVEGDPRTPERQERSAFERARCSGRITSALNATRRSGRRHPAVSAAGPVQVEFLEGPDRRRSKTMEGGRKGQRPATK